jgi:hypothetical protein
VKDSDSCAVVLGHCLWVAQLSGWGGVSVRMRNFGILAVLLFVLIGPVFGQAPVSASVAEQYLFACANAERAERGLPTLRWSVTLYEAADGHAREMAARASISHQYPGEPELAARGRSAGARFSEIAENVAQAPTAVLIHDAWMKSAGHRANLLDPNVDSVGIRVLKRNGQLYAVQDFSRSVQDLSLDEQERMVGALLQEQAAITLLSAPDDARGTCAMETGYSGEARPGFVMRYTAADLTRLPDALKLRLASGKYRRGVVGACAVKGRQSFSAYNIAVLLYP